MFLRHFLCIALIGFGSIVFGLEFRYHKNTELEGVLKNFSAIRKEPLRMQVFSLNKTRAGNELWVLKITASNATTIGIPNIKLIGNMHGDEAAGREVLLHFIEHLIENYLKDGNVTWLLNNTNIFILPSLNPDGFAISHGFCQDQKEGRLVPIVDVDLNRNFPSVYFDNSNVINPNVIESSSIMKWMENNTFILSAALHGGALVANYPYDIRKEVKTNIKEPSYTPDQDVFYHLATTYSRNHVTMHKGESCPGIGFNFTDGVVNGALWYELDGGMGDYNYAYHGCMEVTFEISCCKYPLEKDLKNIWEENREALLQYCMQAHKGVTGQILDYDTNLPITNANLTITGRPITFWSSKDRGEFWRILLPRDYELEVNAPGYHPIKQSFKVNSYEKTYPVLTFLKIHLQNSSKYTTTTVELTTTTRLTSTTTTPNNIQEVLQLGSRFGVDNDIKVGMLLSGVNQNFVVQFVVLKIFLFFVVNLLIR